MASSTNATGEKTKRLSLKRKRATGHSKAGRPKKGPYDEVKKHEEILISIINGLHAEKPDADIGLSVIYTTQAGQKTEIHLKPIYDAEIVKEALQQPKDPNQLEKRTVSNISVVPLRGLRGFGKNSQNAFPETRWARPIPFRFVMWKLTQVFLEMTADLVREANQRQRSLPEDIFGITKAERKELLKLTAGGQTRAIVSDAYAKDFLTRRKQENPDFFRLMVSVDRKSMNMAEMLVYTTNKETTRPPGHPVGPSSNTESVSDRSVSSTDIAAATNVLDAIAVVDVGGADANIPGTSFDLHGGEFCMETGERAKADTQLNTNRAAVRRDGYASFPQSHRMCLTPPSRGLFGLGGDNTDHLDDISMNQRIVHSTPTKIHHQLFDDPTDEPTLFGVDSGDDLFCAGGGSSQDFPFMKSSTTTTFSDKTESLPGTSSSSSSSAWDAYVWENGGKNNETHHTNTTRNPPAAVSSGGGSGSAIDIGQPGNYTSTVPQQQQQPFQNYVQPPLHYEPTPNFLPAMYPPPSGTSGWDVPLQPINHTRICPEIEAMNFLCSIHRGVGRRLRNAEDALSLTEGTIRHLENQRDRNRRALDASEKEYQNEVELRKSFAKKVEDWGHMARSILDNNTTGDMAALRKHIDDIILTGQIYQSSVVATRVLEESRNQRLEDL